MRFNAMSKPKSKTKRDSISHFQGTASAASSEVEARQRYPVTYASPTNFNSSLNVRFLDLLKAVSF